MRFTSLSLEQTWRTGSTQAAASVKMDDRSGFLEVGDPAELILFDYDKDTKSVAIHETVMLA